MRWLNRVYSAVKSITPFQLGETSAQPDVSAQRGTVASAQAPTPGAPDTVSSSDTSAHHARPSSDSVGPEDTPPDRSAVYGRHGSRDYLTLAQMIAKVSRRLAISVFYCLSVGLIPALVLFFVLDTLLELGTVPSWLRTPVLAAASGGMLAIVVLTGVARAGIRVKRKGDRYVVSFRA